MYVIEPMKLEDIPEVTEIERAAFSTAWPAQAYRREITDNRLARYVVARWVDDDSSEAWQLRADSKVSTPPTARGLLGGLRDWLVALFGPEPSYEPPPPSATRHLGGYAGLWLMVDEAHITTIAVRPSLKHYGLGIMLMIALADLALSVGAARMTLEVRVSNYEAQNLYRKFGFHEEGIRRRYYSDNGEDALIMWSEPLESPEFTTRLERVRCELQERLRSHPIPPPDQVPDSAA